MKKLLLLLFILMMALVSADLQAQMSQLHGEFVEIRDGLHAGNLFRTTFYNDGTFGRIQDPPDIAGEWPINSGHLYLIDGNVFVGSEVYDRNNELKHIFSEVRSTGDGSSGAWSSGDTGPNGEWYTFLPLAGFANADTNKIAMNKWPWAWPSVWPDKIDDPVDPGWPGSWNGYFGKNAYNADEESYFVADDYQNKEFNFYPDDNDQERRGLGIRLYVRGFQWANTLVEDALFCLFDLENIGTYDHTKMVFAYKIGNNMGDTETAVDSNDDMGAFNIEEDIAYLYDYDLVGASGWGEDPVGYFGGAFLESPGNFVDGIDNDGDGIDGTGPILTEADFASRTLKIGEQVVIINYETYEREVVTLGTDTLKIVAGDRTLKYWAGMTVVEQPRDLVDNNLNGLIDEINGASVGTPPDEVFNYLYTGVKYKNYITGEGEDNDLIDERRDDGIDNDHDWNGEFDDLGADGLDFSGDTGEKDGLPTYGEPHFDKTDIDETDMLGLTSFTLYRWEDIPHYEDELVWDATIPGYLDDVMNNDNIELLWGSGYFPMKAGSIERFSMGIIAGYDEADLLINKQWVSKAYNENYNFSKAPIVPKVQAIAGDKKVTLIWDDAAESSKDPITGEDFEGYRIYRSTDKSWSDMTDVTDGYGYSTYRIPIAQFDLDNGYSGFAPVGIKGVHFNLGDDTGLVHKYVDENVVNGQTYYYAVCSYDRGAPEMSIPPTECSKFISVNTNGDIDIGQNVAIVRPEAPSAGYVDADFDSSKIYKLPGSTTAGQITYEIVNPLAILDGQTYQITFEDTTGGTRTIPLPATRCFNLIRLPSDTLIKQSKAFDGSESVPMIDGFELTFSVSATELSFDSENSGWSRSGLYVPSVRPLTVKDVETVLDPGGYRLEYGELGDATSTYFMRGSTELPAIPVNFKIFSTITNEEVKFAFRERDILDGEDGLFTARTAGSSSDEIIILNDDLKAGWQISMNRSGADSLPPEPGDVLNIELTNPFLSNDVFQFTTILPHIDQELAKEDLDNIRVVPNPYVVSNSWEPHNPYANGRGPRELHFIHLPQKCTIKIFNVRGQLVRKLEHDSALWDGTEIWDMLTRDNLDVSYGVYVYHVEAEGLGSKIGKFAIIK